MKKINVTQLPKKLIQHELFNIGQNTLTNSKFRMKIDTLSELHNQLRHHEYKESTSPIAGLSS